MKPTQKQIAQALRIDAALVTRYKARGMPVDSIEAARHWHIGHVGLRASMRSSYGSTQPAPSAPQPCSAAFIAAENLAEHAAELLSNGTTSIDALVPSLRATLRAVPTDERPRLKLPLSVLNVLTADVLAAVRTEEPQPGDGGQMGDEDAEQMGRFWFSVCAGEVMLSDPDSAAVSAPPIGEGEK